MDLPSRLFSILVLSTTILVISSCSIYRNKGRDQFESRSTGNIRTDIGVSQTQPEPIFEEKADSCWVQNMNEALWTVPTGSTLDVHKIDETRISVCVSETPSRQGSKND